MWVIVTITDSINTAREIIRTEIDLAIRRPATENIHIVVLTADVPGGFTT